MRILKTQATSVIKDMEHTNLITFNNVPTEFIEHNGETFTARSFLCYNWEIILDGEKVCINPMNYNRGLREIDFHHTENGDFHSDNLWVLFNIDKVLVWNSTRHEVVGEVTKVLDPRNTAERIRDLQAKGEL